MIHLDGSWCDATQLKDMQWARVKIQSWRVRASSEAQSLAVHNEVESIDAESESNGYGLLLASLCCVALFKQDLIALNALQILTSTLPPKLKHWHLAPLGYFSVQDWQQVLAAGMQNSESPSKKQLHQC
ncbi:hypothetical protein D5086_014566 [Populus alba]|uniref:Uncharacterized protein n=1 Tax=Populus alba TaxID=43335 RepID=A0ACC4BY21_POPAL